METERVREYLKNVYDPTWAILGSFFSRYVSDEELQRWSKYQKSLGFESSEEYTQAEFSDMLVYFLESVFQSADRFHHLPDILKEFLTTSGDSMLEIGVFLDRAVRAYKQQGELLETLRKNRSK